MENTERMQGALAETAQRGAMPEVLSVKRLDTTHTMDVTEDFVLPDYISEVRRIVGVQGSASVDGKYLNGQELEADGGVTYTVLYLGGEGGLCSIPLTTSFEGKIPIKTDENDRLGTEDISLGAWAENVTCRVTAPRRLTLSCKVKMRLFSQREVACTVTAHPPESGKGTPVRVKREEAEYASVKAYRSTVECGGELREREGTKIISAQGAVMVSETRIAPEGIMASGEGRVSLLLLTPDGVYTTAKGRCPMEVVFACPTEGVLSAAASGRCLMCEVEMGDDGTISWNLECDVDCDVLRGGRSAVPVDGYCVDYEDECDFAEHRALSAVRGLNGRLTLSGTRKISPDMSFAGGFGRAFFDKAELSEGKLTLSGSAVITAILCGKGEAAAEECVIPVKYECGTDVRGSHEVTGRWEAVVCDVSGRCDGETLNVTAELGFSGVFLAEKAVRTLAAIRPVEDRPVPHRKNVLRICVPHPDESPWDVMKRCRIPTDSPKKSGRVYIVT